MSCDCWCSVPLLHAATGCVIVVIILTTLTLYHGVTRVVALKTYLVSVVLLAVGIKYLGVVYSYTTESQVGG